MLKNSRIWGGGRKAVNPLRLAREMDLTVLLPALLLSLIGIAMVYSATYNKPDMANLYLKQLTWLSLASVGLLFFASWNYQVLLERYTLPLYWGSILGLILVLAMGDKISGSQRWIDLGFFSLQPSEFAKIATVLLLARYFSLRQDRLAQWKTIAGGGLITLLPMMLILRQPDLGSALVFMPMLFSMMFLIGVPWQRLGAILGTGLAASPLFWFFLKDYQRQRVMVFINPSADSLGAGYNVIQSKIAVGSGGLTGKGWLFGTQGQLQFVPEHHTDFIFSVLAEEWGFLGALVLLALFLILLLQSLRIARVARDLGGSAVAVGVTTVLFTQVAINISVAVGLLPVTGMTLPFISYGGSSMLANFCMIGLLMNIWSGRMVK
jgi:rod shape determining protein RodA